MNIIFGAQYKHALTGRVVVLAAAGAASFIIQPGDNPDDFEKVPKLVFLEEYEEVGNHNHEAYCCKEHATHTNPHKGCALR